MRWSHRLAHCLLISLLWTAAPLAAVVLTVDAEVDAVDAEPGDGRCATAAGRCSLRAAVQEANALRGGDEIALPAGRFPLALAGSPEDRAANGDLDLAGPLLIHGIPGQTVIDGAGQDGVFEVVGPGGQAVFRDLRIEGAAQAALVCRDATECELQRVQLSGNAGSAAVACEGTAACRFEGVVVDHNTAAVGVSCGRCELEDTRIADNASVGIQWEDQRVSLAHSVVERNGGAGLLGSKRSRNLVVVDSTVQGNRQGGIDTGGRITVLRSAIVANQRSQDCGGGIRLEGGPTSGSTLIASTLSGNAAPRGGGLCLLWLGGNVNPYIGILGSTIADNRADAGGGILVIPELHHLGPPGPGFQLEESILAGNHAKVGPDCVAGPIKRSGEPSAVSLGWNLLGDASDCPFSPAEGDLIGSATAPLDADLGPLTAQGAQTPAQVPSATSPALDRIPAQACATSSLIDPTYVQQRMLTAANSDFARTGLVGVRDTRWIVFSGWFEFLQPIGSVEHLLSVGDGQTQETTFVQIARDASGRLRIEIRAATGQTILDATSHQIIPSFEPHSLVFGFNAGINALDAFLDDVEITFERRPGSRRGLIPYATRGEATWRLFGRHDGGGEAFVGRVADFWVDNEFLSVDSGSHRYDFYDLNNRAIDLGEDGRVATKRGEEPPLIYFGHAMRAADWNAGANRGRGGPFEVGVGVSDVVESPSDPQPHLDQWGVVRPHAGACEVGAVERSK